MGCSLYIVRTRDAVGAINFDTNQLEFINQELRPCAQCLPVNYSEIGSVWHFKGAGGSQFGSSDRRRASRSGVHGAAGSVEAARDRSPTPSDCCCAAFRTASWRVRAAINSLLIFNSSSTVSSV